MFVIKISAWTFPGTWVLSPAWAHFSLIKNAFDINASGKTNTKHQRENRARFVNVYTLQYFVLLARRSKIPLKANFNIAHSPIHLKYTMTLIRTRTCPSGHPSIYLTTQSTHECWALDARRYRRLVEMALLTTQTCHCTCILYSVVYVCTMYMYIF